MNRENPQLEEAIQALHQQMDDNPTSEKPLDELIKIEEALRFMLEIKELSKETKAEIDRVLIGLTGRTISAFLDEIHERAFRVMKSDSVEAKEDIEGYLAKLKIVYRKVERVILKPDERNAYITGSGKGIEKKELHTNKLQHLLELLRANEIYTDDICIVIGENIPNMMREGSYLYIEIPKVKRTVLLHLGYGEASFVLYDIYERAMVFDMTKEQIQEKLGAAKVEYSERDLNKWGTEMLKVLKLNEAVAQPKINMGNYDRRLFYIEEIKKLFSTPEKFMKIEKSFKLYGKGLTYLATVITGKVRLLPASYSLDMAILTKEIYGEGHDVIEEAIRKAEEESKKEAEIKASSKEKWIEEIKIEYPKPEKFLKLKMSQKKSFKQLYGIGLMRLATIITGKAGLNPIGYPLDMAILAKEIYGEGHDVIEEAIKEAEEESKKQVETEGWSREKWIEEIKIGYPTPEKFMALKTLQKKSIKQLYGIGLMRLATIIAGKTGLNPNGYFGDMAILAKEIYGEGHDVIEEAIKKAEEEAKKEVETEGWSREKWVEEIKIGYPTPEKFMELKTLQNKSIKQLYGIGLTRLATIITGQKDLCPAGRKYDFAVLAEAIYGKGYKVIEEGFKKDDETDSWTKEKWIEEIKLLYPTPEEFMTLDTKQKLALKIHGKGITALSTLITGESQLYPASSSKNLALMASEIYGEGYEVIKEVLKTGATKSWTKEKWIEEIKLLYPTPEEFMQLDTPQKDSFGINGIGLIAITSAITGVAGLSPASTLKDFASLARIIYGAGHECIDNVLVVDQTEEWSRKKWIEEIKKQFPTPADILKLTSKQKRKFKLFRKGLQYLATKITDKKLKPIGYSHDMEILAEAIYGENDKKSDNN